MEAVSKELLTLPPQLLEAIRDLSAADVDLPEDLRRDLKRDNAISDEVEVEEASEHAVTIPQKTVELDAVERLARWASTSGGTVQLKRGGLDPQRYGLITLLAGTEIYMPAAKRDRLLAASSANADKSNPYLPSYLSPAAPSLGQELRAVTSQLTTILNVLFSVGGSAAAVYVAAVTGAGYKRETAVLLGLLAAIVVGIADSVLIWIYSTRLESGRKESKKRAAILNKGSGEIKVETQGTDAPSPITELLESNPKGDSVQLRKRPATRAKSS